MKIDLNTNKFLNYKIKNNKESYIITFLSSLFIFLLIFLIYEIVPFGNNSLCTNDGVAQYIPFISDFYTKIKEGESLLYSFNGGLGYNLFGTIAYYLLSPFSFIALFFKKENLTLAVNLIILLKISCIAISMNYYLLNRFKQKKYIYSIVFSLAYSFSYFFIGYMYNFMWLDCIILLPFILRGLETITTKKGKIQYTICLSLCMLSNFYLAVIVCIFLFLYYLLIIEYKTFKEFIIKTFNFGSFSIIAALMACITLIPMGINIFSMGSSRTNFPDFEFFNNLTYIFERHLPFIDIKTLSTNNGDANLFCTIGILLFSSLFIFNKTIPTKRKISTIILSTFLLFSFTNSWTNFIMHGFYSQRQIPNRFAFLYIFMLVIMAYESVVYLKGINKKSLMLTNIISLIFLISIYLDINYSSLAKDELLIKAVTFAYCIIALIIYSISIIKNKEKIIIKTIPILIFIEILTGITQIQYTTLSDSYEKQTNYQNAMIQSDEFFREELLSSSVTNAPTLYGMNGITSFNSIINSDTAGILGQLGFASGENYYRYFGHTPLTDAMLNIKYIYSKYGETLPFNFEYLQTVDGINIYKNKYVLPIGYSADMSSLDTNYANKFDNLNNLTKEYGTLFRGIPITTNYDSDNCEITKKDNSNFIVTSKNKNDTFTFTLEPLEEKNVYIYTKLSTGSNLTIKVNERIVTSSSYSGYISYLGNITKDDIITIKYTSKNAFENKSATIFVSSLNRDIFEAYYYDTLEHSLTDVKINKNTIHGKFISSKDNTQIIFTLPYDKGWTIFVNDKKYELENIRNGFCAVTVDKGQHDIRLEYVPAGLKLGTIISISSTVLFLSYSIIDFKKKPKFSKSSEL